MNSDKCTSHLNNHAKKVYNKRITEPNEKTVAAVMSKLTLRRFAAPTTTDVSVFLLQYGAIKYENIKTLTAL